MTKSVNSHEAKTRLSRLVEQAAAGREFVTAKANVYVSAASIWEISIKSAQGRLKIDPVAALRAVEPTGFSMLSITGDHATRVYDLGKHHDDPFDRPLVAQAQVKIDDLAHQG